MRLLATYGSKRTKRWSHVPTLNELGYDTVSDSPFGIAGPKGMDPKVVRKLQDAFKKTLSDPAVLAAFEKYDQPVIYMDSEEYTQFILASYVREKRTIERLGLGYGDANMLALRARDAALHVGVAAEADPLDAIEADFVAAESTGRLAQAVRQTVQSNRRQVVKAA